jgi:hypothetical protein
MASSDELSKVRQVAEGIVRDCGGSEVEARVIGHAVVEYVKECWIGLRLDVISEDASAWDRHITRQALRMWIEELKIAKGTPWPKMENPLDHRARALIRVRADAANLTPEQRRLLDGIYVEGLTVAEAALASGLSDEDARTELRAAWGAVREQFPDLY